jgi:4-diphosphocytidyl-2-C-methyl-D-erythritol kinase
VDQVRRLCPAKVNLYLKVLGRRADGYHDLVTVMQPLSLADVLTVTRAGAGIALACDQQNLPAGPGNLVWRAALAFQEAAGMELAVHLDLLKRTPVAAGLGGGSSDAAGTLLALNRLYGSPLDDAALHALAGGLGADVPFFLQTGSQLARGIGTDVAPFPVPVFWYLLLNPGYRVSTRTVYQGLDLAAVPTRTPPLPPDAACLPPRAWVSNDLETVTLRLFPRLKDWLSLLDASGAAAWGMSGSGSTLFGIFPDDRATLDAARQVRRDFDGWMAVARGLAAGEPETAWEEQLWII